MNPIKQARQARGLSQKDLAEHLGVSPHALLRYEQGLYEEISPHILNYVSGLADLPIARIKNDYRIFRLETQQRAKSLFYPLPVVRITPEEHPFTYFRRECMERRTGKDSRIGFCILLAMNPAVVLNYDKGKQGPMPALIKQALKNAEVYDNYIELLDTYGQLWHERYGQND